MKEVVAKRRFGDPISSPPEEQEPKLIALLGVGLLIDLTMVGIVFCDLPDSLWKAWHWSFIGLSIGQISLDCAIRLRYESCKWTEYSIVFIVAALGAFIMLFDQTTFKLFLGWKSTYSQRVMVIYLWGVSMLVFYCAFPGALFRKRTLIKGKKGQFHLRHLMALCVVVAFTIIFLRYLFEFLAFGLYVFFLSLPAIVGCWYLAAKESYAGFGWVLLASTVVPGLVKFGTGGFSKETLVFDLVEVGTVLIGGSYLLQYPREPSVTSKEQRSD